ncbi:MAG TPA: hypothetical protein VGV37_06490 [Aliidongia sp.]|uniref:hypothetical protein n=1 Tax=Aliidongia sp. TaxID=1914230 RepID=UPI002DDD0F26|nr:hypothetical protein [Aliidongia sp.]HEV2674174.1 hypothetical protein [Aliidongia sp.]
MKRGIGNAGNVNMRGRGKEYSFSCGCCSVYDDRAELIWKAVKREMLDEAVGPVETVKEG